MVIKDKQRNLYYESVKDLQKIIQKQRVTSIAKDILVRLIISFKLQERRDSMLRVYMRDYFSA